MLTTESKVLIVDDHALMRLAIRGILANFIPEENILETNSCNNLIKIIKSELNLELLLLDLFMPGMDTFDAMEEIKKISPDLPIIIVSASEQPSHIQKAIDLGIKGYIPKTYGLKKIQKALKHIFSGKQYIPIKLQNRVSNDNIEAIASRVEKTLPLDLTINKLTRRQFQIFKLLGEGKSNKEIADIIRISVNTVKVHVSAILKAFDFENRSQVGIVSRNFFKDLPSE